MSLAQHDYMDDADWQFIPRLSTAHVWDSFVIYSLLDDKRRTHQQLQVPHDGIQANRFKNAMKERNEHIIHYGQPNAVNHACDKCLRIYEKDGERRKLRYLLLSATVTQKAFKVNVRPLSVMEYAWVVHAVVFLLAPRI